MHYIGMMYCDSDMLGAALLYWDHASCAFPYPVVDIMKQTRVELPRHICYAQITAASRCSTLALQLQNAVIR